VNDRVADTTFTRDQIQDGLYSSAMCDEFDDWSKSLESIKLWLFPLDSGWPVKRNDEYEDGWSKSLESMKLWLYGFSLFMCESKW
jgi:hypothetical protein